jgi:two-component system nitrate/nitrite response regulator NarL
MHAERTRVMVAEDHPIYRQGLADAIRARTELALVAEAGEGRAALDQIRRLGPDVAVLDVKMPQLDGLQVLRAIRREGRVTRIILLSAFIDGELVHKALSGGAAGFLSKESSGVRVCEAVAVVARGEIVLAPEIQAALAGELRLRAPAEGPRLSEREMEILVLLAEGLSSGDIARRLMVSMSTVKSHLGHLYDKLEVSDRAAAVARGCARGSLSSRACAHTASLMPRRISHRLTA